MVTSPISASKSAGLKIPSLPPVRLALESVECCRHVLIALVNFFDPVRFYLCSFVRDLKVEVEHFSGVLLEAIEAGGSSLRDHRQTSGELGYFQHSFAVYGRAGEACPGCDCDIAKTGYVRGANATVAKFKTSAFTPVLARLLEFTPHTNPGAR